MTNDESRHNMTALDTDLLSDLIRRKHNCLLHLRDLGERQLELVREGGMSELLDVLAAKQQMLVELQRIERGLDPFRDQDPDARLWRSPDDRRRCAEQLARCEALLAEIVIQEKRSETDLIHRRDEAARRLQGVHTAAQARDAYMARPQQAAAGLDLTS